MIVSSVVFVAAIVMAGIAAYVSVLGLAAIFSAAGMLFIAFAASMEVAKVSCAMWLHAHWKDSGLRMIKVGMLISVLVLMIFTSIGVFGFLSKSHIEQTAPLSGIIESNDVMVKKIESIQGRIDRNNRLIEQLDQAIQGYIDNDYITKAIQVREQQSGDRARISSENDELQSQIDAMRVSIAEANVTVQSIETEVGPIKYVAEMIYGTSDKDVLEKSVRILIMMMVLVFDPLAIMMLVAAQYSFRRKREGNGSEVHGDPKEKDSGRIEAVSEAQVEESQGFGGLHLDRYIPPKRSPEDTWWEYTNTGTVPDVDPVDSEAPETISEDEQEELEPDPKETSVVEEEPEVGVSLAAPSKDILEGINLDGISPARRRAISRVLNKNKKMIDRLSR